MWQKIYNCVNFFLFLSLSFFFFLWPVTENIPTSPTEGFFVLHPPSPRPPGNSGLFSYISSKKLAFKIPLPPRNFQSPSMAWVCFFSGTTHYLLCGAKFLCTRFLFLHKFIELACKSGWRIFTSLDCVEFLHSRHSRVLSTYHWNCLHIGVQNFCVSCF